MPLSLQQIGQLANEFDINQWDLPRLTLFAASFNVNLGNLAMNGFKETAYSFVMEMNRGVPPRDRELLLALSRENNERLADVAREMLRPGFFPPGDAHEALLLGRTAFVARKELREKISEFTNPGPNDTHVLIVRGSEPGGKSYSWEFLRHLAISVAGVQPVRLNLKGTNYTPRQFVQQAMNLLRLKPDQDLPELADNPQLARTSPLLNSFKGRFVDLDRPYWLVIDDLNEPSVTPAVRETAYAMAFVVEELKPDKLWLVLLGYNPEIIDPDLRWVAQDDANFPGASSVARFFVSIAQASGTPLETAQAEQIANLLFNQYPKKLDKEAMGRLTVAFEQMSQKIRSGQTP